MRKLAARLTDDRGGTGTVDRHTMAFRATPWIERETGGGHVLYTGRDGSLWIYSVIRNHPLYYEDDGTILDVGRRVENVLLEIGRTSLSRSFGIRSTASYRDIHVLSARWEGTPEVPPGTPTPAQAAYLTDVLEDLHLPRQVTFLGVKLRDIDAVAAARARERSAGSPPPSAATPTAPIAADQCAVVADIPAFGAVDVGSSDPLSEPVTGLTAVVAAQGLG